MSDIRITASPQQVAAKADVVSAKAQTMAGHFDAMKETVNRSASYWQGDASEAHRNAYSKKLPVIREILSRLNEHAADLKNIALNYETAEKEVQETASGLPEDVII